MTLIDGDGAALFFTEGGSGRPVLFLHSLGGSGEMWAHTFDAVASGQRAIALDARGHGGSAAEGEISVEQFAADVLTLVDALALTDVTIVGISMGGQAAMHVALRAPGRVRGLVLADTSLGGRGGAAERVAATKARIDEIGTAAFAQEYTRSRLMPEATDDVVETFARLVRKTLPEVYLRQVGSIASQDLRETAPEIAVPTLVLVGSHDVSTPPAMAAQLREAIPDADLMVIERANHLSNLDQPAVFAAAVAGFLDRLG